MATGDALKSTKAVAGAVAAFLTPGAIYLVGVSGDGISGKEWLLAALICFVPAGTVAGTVYFTENKPKAS